MLLRHIQHTSIVGIHRNGKGSHLHAIGIHFDRLWTSILEKSDDDPRHRSSACPSGWWQNGKTDAPVLDVRAHTLNRFIQPGQTKGKSLTHQDTIVGVGVRFV